MRRVAVSLHNQQVTLGAAGTDAEAVLDFVCQGLQTEPARESRIELRTADSGELSLFRDAVLVETVHSKAAAIEGLMRELTLALVWDYRDGLAIHAAAVELAQGAILFPAVSGAGKSTLSVYCAARGVTLLSDELVFIPHASDLAHPLHRPAHLKPGSAFLLDEFPALGQAPHCVTSTAGAFLAPAAFSATSGSPSPLRAIVFPSYSPKARCEIEPLSPGLAAFSLLGALVNARNVQGLGVPEVGRIASHVPAIRISYGQLDRAFDAICDFSRATD